MTEAHRRRGNSPPDMLSPTTVPSYASVWASASIAGHTGMLRIGVTNWAGKPTAAVMKYSTASPRRPDDTSLPICWT